MNSTFSANLVGGGQIASRGTAKVILQNTLIADPRSTVPNNCYVNNPNNIADNSGNLRWPTTDPTCVGSYGDPNLGPLANNGGPTQTMALGPGSAAIDAGLPGNGAPTVDQRGVARSTPPDIGAYENTQDNR